METPTGSRSRRHRAKKESKHYQESDILESPQIYCRSALGDKISDYEDLWSPQDVITNTPLSRGPLMSSFRPDDSCLLNKRPDLLPDTRKFIINIKLKLSIQLFIVILIHSYDSLT